MKVAIGGISHETNTFASQKTSWREFKVGKIIHKEDLIKHFENTSGTLGGAINAAVHLGIEIIPTLYTEATPSGLVDDDVFENLVAELCRNIDPGVDGVLLTLHGAMVTDRKEDAEGYLLKKVRDTIGLNKPVVCTLDLHANVSPEIVELSQCLVGFDTYPHTDYYDRGKEAMEILHGIIGNTIKPTMALAKPLFMPVVQKMHTEVSPMQDLFALAHFFEETKKEVVNITISGGFPYADVKWAGISFIVTTNNDLELAQSICQKFEEKLWALKEEFLFQNKTVYEGVQKAKKSKKFPFILVDSSDNVGGGSSGDSTEVLREVISQGLSSCLAILKDAEVVALASKAGVGEKINFMLGGKTDNLHGVSLSLEGVVLEISDGHYRSERTGESQFMGKTAVIESEGNTLVITEEKVPPFDLEALQSIGIDPAEMKYIIVKGAIQWKSSYGKVARDWIEVDASGVTSSNLQRFSYKNIRRPIFPLDA